MDGANINDSTRVLSSSLFMFSGVGELEAVELAVIVLLYITEIPRI